LRGGGNTINPRTERNKLWPGATVPFEIDSTQYPVGKRARNIILQAINEWNAADTGFKLVPRMHQTDYLIFGEEDGVCYSNVGRQGARQYIRCDLDKGGFNKRSIKHEIGHAIGLYHEHQRDDRDAYVSVSRHARLMKSNNYQKEGNVFGKYDINSIMHYYLSDDLQPAQGIIIDRPDLVGTQDKLSKGDLAAARYLADFAKNVKARAALTIATTSKQERHGLRLFSRRKAPEHEKLARKAELAYRLKDFVSVHNYLLALIVEYGTVLSQAKMSELYNDCGDCAFQLKHYAKAQDYFQRSLQYDQNNKLAYENLAITQQYLAQSQPTFECTIL